MRVSMIVASALGLAFAESGAAFSSEEERAKRVLRAAYNNVSYERSQQQSTAHESTSRHNALPVRTRSHAQFRGSKRAFPSRISPPGVRLFIFSPRRKAWAAYLPNGRLVGYGRASGGAHWCKDVGRSCRTPRGRFTIHSRGSAGCRSGRYPLPRGGAPMPHCMFFSKYYAIHGSPHVPNYNASHGCIRVKPNAAKWLRYNFITIGTRVVVTSY